MVHFPFFITPITTAIFSTGLNNTYFSNCTLLYILIIRYKLIRHITLLAHPLMKLPGVSMASLTELSFNWTGFINAMISNISFTYRSIYSKKAMVCASSVLIS